jgi:hypothetical protein
VTLALFVRAALVALFTALLVALAPVAVAAWTGGIFVPENLACGPVECGWPWYWATLELWLLGLAAGGLELVEERSRMWRKVQLLRVFVASGLVAAVWFAAATFQFCYVQVVLWNGSLGRAVRSPGGLGFLRDEIRDVHPIYVGIALPLVLGSLARARGVGLAAQSAIGGGISAGIALVSAAFLDWDTTLLRYAVFMATLGALAPLARVLAAFSVDRMCGDARRAPST